MQADKTVCPEMDKNINNNHVLVNVSIQRTVESKRSKLVSSCTPEQEQDTTTRDRLNMEYEPGKCLFELAQPDQSLSRIIDHAYVDVDEGSRDTGRGPTALRWQATPDDGCSLTLKGGSTRVVQLGSSVPSHATASSNCTECAILFTRSRPLLTDGRTRAERTRLPSQCMDCLSPTGHETTPLVKRTLKCKDKVAPERKRTSYDNAFKLKVVLHAKASKSNRATAKHFDIAERQVRCWLKQQAELQVSNSTLFNLAINVIIICFIAML